MISTKRCPLPIIFAVLASSALADADITFDNPNLFKDIEQSGFTRSQSVEQFKIRMTRFITEMADRHIPEGQHLKFTFTDVDLPGHMNYHAGGGSSLRVVSSNSPFHIDFTYEVLNSNNDVLKRESVRLHEFVGSSDVVRAAQTARPDYDEWALEDWFEETFPVDETD